MGIALSVVLDDLSLDHCPVVCFILWKVSQTQRDQGFSGAFWAEKTESGLIFRLSTTPAKRVGVERTGYLTTPTTNFELKFLEN